MKNRITAILLFLIFCFAAPVLAKSEELFSAVDLTPFAGEAVTRAEFTAKVAGVLKLTYVEGQDRFGDLEGHEYHDSICAALGAGLIAPADKFNPDDKILTIDAYRIALAATGWVPRVKSMGGNDWDYLSVAQNLYLTDGILGDPYAPLTVEDANTLLSNMLRSETEQQVVFGDKVVYQSRKGNTLLSMLYNIKEVTGIVSANEYTGLNAADGAVEKDRIKIGSVEYVAENRQDFLGMNVRAYYIANSPQGRNVIVALEKVDTRELTIEGKQIAKVEGRKLSYYEGDRLITVRLDDSFSCIKNGKKLDLYTGDLKAAFTPSQNTELTLIDANQDKKYETVLMTVRQYCYVEAVDDKGVFYDKCDTANNIDLSDSHIQYRFLNKEMGSEDVKVGMVLTFTRSDDGKLLTIETEYSTIEGAIEVIYSEDETLVINGQRYELTDYYTKHFSSVALGKRGMFLLDSRGRLVAYDVDEEQMLYGWVLAMAEQGLFTETLSAKIYTQNDKAEIFDFAEKVKLDGGDAEKVSKNIIENCLKPENRLVKFKLNKDGVISEIYFPKAVNKFEDIQNQENQFLQYHNGTYRWQSDAKMFMEGFILDSGTTLFVVPETESLRADEQNFNVFSGASSNFSSTSSYSVTSFDLSSEGIASVVLYLSDVYTVTETSLMPRGRDGYAWVVEDKCYGMDEEGTPRIELFVCNGSTYQTVYSNENNYNELESVEPGDIIRFVEESNHVIKLFHQDFDFSSKTLNEKDYALAKNFTGGAGYVQGYLYGKYATFMQIFEEPYNGERIDKTNCIYADIKGYPVSSTYTIYVDVVVDKSGDIRSLKTYRAGSGVMPLEYRLTGDGRASYVVSLFRSGSTRSTVIYNIHAE